MNAAGPPIYVYELVQNGQYAFPTIAEPSLFNAGAYALGAATPPSTSLLASSSTFGGSPGAPYDLTLPANQMAGTSLITCTTTADFLYENSPDCNSAAGSVSGNVHELIAVQSWPLYVDSAGASNVTPGTFTFETDTDDGSWIVLAPAAFTYAQPGNFANATGLTAGTAVVNAGKLQGATSTQGTFTLAAAGAGNACSANLYWITWEYFEAQGGSSLIEYSWQPPGIGQLVQANQDILYGEVTKNGAAKSGETVSYSINGGASTTLTTDVNGCYGVDITPSTSTQTVGLTAKDIASGQTQTANVVISAGNALIQNFAFPNEPSISLYKRITKVVSGGVTTIPPADAGNPTGVLGTANYTAGVYTGDKITYTIYFVNTGTYQAQGATAAVGPTFTDAVPANTTLVAASEAFTCCSNPTASTTATLTAGASVSYAMNAPLAPLTVAGSVQGSFSFTVTVN